MVRQVISVVLYSESSQFESHPQNQLFWTYFWFLSSLSCECWICTLQYVMTTSSVLCNSLAISILSFAEWYQPCSHDVSISKILTRHVLNMSSIVTTTVLCDARVCSLTCSFETMLWVYQTTQCHIPKNWCFNILHENLRSEDWAGWCSITA